VPATVDVDEAAPAAASEAHAVTAGDGAAGTLRPPAGHGGADGGTRRGKPAGRGRKQSRLFELRGELPSSWRWGLGGLGLLAVFALWIWAAGRNTETVLVPTPAETWQAFKVQWENGNFWKDLQASTGRIFYGYVISMAIGIVVGIAIGSLRSAEAFFEAPVAFLRYIPATALVPLMLIWLGIDEAPKITLIVLGTVFFNILMIADVARAVPRELIEASYTLGARRRTVLRKVVLRHSVPGIIDVGRINLAAGWLVLVVAELLAADQGLAFRIVKAQRFRQVDTMFAMLIVFGIIGVVSDLALRWLRNASSPWARS
jgi:NitT/TauT family transport system permease protein